MRWVLIILTVLLGLSVLGRLHHHVPGQEEKPSLAKAVLCGVAEGTHSALIKRSIEHGLVITAGEGPERTYVLKVEDELWAAEPVSSKEVLAIAAWCQVAGEDGRAIASVIGARANDELAHVIEGEFSLVERTF